jgi:hypothetical protein
MRRFRHKCGEKRPPARPRRRLKIILICMKNEKGKNAWNKFIWFRIRTSGIFFEHFYESSRFVKCNVWGILE